MWICPECNQLVPNPVKGKCPNGHGLFDGGIMSWPTEQPAGKAFVNALLVCLGIAVAVTAINGLIRSKPLGHDALGYTSVFFIAFGFSALLRAFKWKRRGGPVVRLVPRAVGLGLGFIVAGGGLFALGSAVGLIH